MPPTVLLDTAVLVYAIGAEHPLREPCRRLLRAIGEGEIDGAISALAVQELLHQRARRLGDRGQAAQQVRPLTEALPIFPVGADEARRAVDLYGRSARLDDADAVHAATALSNGVATLVSPDPAFDDVAGLTRVDPRQAAEGLASLTPVRGVSPVQGKTY